MSGLLLHSSNGCSVTLGSTHSFQFIANRHMLKAIITIQDKLLPLKISEKERVTSVYDVSRFIRFNQLSSPLRETLLTVIE